MSAPSGITGAPSPLQAAQTFVARATVPRYGALTTPWSVSGRDAHGGVTLRSGLFWLHATQLSDTTWVIDSGGRCT